MLLPEVSQLSSWISCEFLELSRSDKPWNVVSPSIANDEVICIWFSIPVNRTQELKVMYEQASIPHDLNVFLWNAGPILMTWKVLQELFGQDQCPYSFALLPCLALCGPDLVPLGPWYSACEFLCLKLFK